jgi:hypothetical protein
MKDHGPDVQQTHDAHHNPSPRVRSHACAAMVNLVDFCEPDLLRPYLDTVLAAALGVMQVG